MPTTLHQKNRLLSIDMPLNNETEWQLVRLQGREAISALYRFQCELICKNPIRQVNKYYGKPVTCIIDHTENPRYLHGYIHHLHPSRIDYNGQQHYQLSIVPQLWYLTRGRDSQIYQHKTVPQIITEKLKLHGIYAINVRNLSEDYPEHDYVVQHQESHYDFLSRLMASAGIYYYFRHEKNRHVLVLGDSPKAYHRDSNALKHCSDWRREVCYSTQNIQQTSYNFKTPTNLIVNKIGRQNSKDIYKEYPNYQKTQAAGERHVELQQQILDASTDITTFASDNANLQTGMHIAAARSSATNHPNHYLISELKHDIVDNSFFSGQRTANKTSAQQYKNHVTNIPVKKYYRPKLSLAPLMPSLQTAKVTTEKNQTLQTDNFGRVKVHFHWDIHQAAIANSSCWIRVAQAWAGKQHGIQFIPRVDDEVVVYHHHGDLNQPYINGALYNGDNMPPYKLPNNNQQSGIKTHSVGSDDDQDYSEWRFDDTAKAEKINLQAQKDLATKVGEASTQTIRHKKSVSLQKGNKQLQAKGKICLISASQIILQVNASRIQMNGANIAIKTLQSNLHSATSDNAQPAARLGDNHQCPKRTATIAHKGGPILTGSQDVFINGRPVARLTDQIHCRIETDQITQGAPGVTINGIPAARLADASQHGGVITTGAASVMIGGNASLVPTAPTPQHQYQFTHQLRHNNKLKVPVRGMQYTAIDSLGQKHTGITDNQGQAVIRNLPPGRVEGYYGQPKKTAKKLMLQHQQLKQYLNEIIQEEIAVQQKRACWKK